MQGREREKVDDLLKESGQLVHDVHCGAHLALPDLCTAVQEQEDKEDLSKFGLSPSLSEATGFFRLIAPEAGMIAF